MARAPKDKEREHLEHEIEREDYPPLLLRLQRGHPFLRQFATWGDVVAFMREGSSRSSRKDDVLRPILAAHAEDGDPRWRAILLLIFWPGLKSICIRRCNRDSEFDEIWANAVWAFLEAVCRLDLAKRADRLVQKLVNDTTSRLRAECRCARNRASVEIPTDPQKIEGLAGPAEDPGFAELEFSEAQELRIAGIRDHLEAGRISETDFNLLVGTRIYGKHLRECAEEAGLSCQAARKRRRRAEVAILRFEEKS